MDLSKIAIEPRLRNGWEAIDLGFVMAKRWFVPLWLSWTVPSSIVLVLLLLVVPNHSWISIFVVWWLKPLWDRLPLVYGSRALFGEHVSVAALLKKCLHTFKADWFASLTWRRLSPTRSFDLSLTVLEGLRSDARARRMTGLHHTVGNAAIWLTISCAHVEQIIAFSVWGVVIMMAPEQYQEGLWEAVMSPDFGWSQVSVLLAYLVMTLVAPFYVMGGFALYISRRIELEAWDIEVRFRHLAERAAKQKEGKSRSAISLLCGMILLGSLWGFPPAGNTEEVAEPEFVREYYQNLADDEEATAAKTHVIEILSGEDFHRYELKEGWRFKESEPKEADPESIIGFLKAIAKFFEFLQPLRDGFGAFAVLIEIAFWVLLASLVGYLIYRYRNGVLALFGAKTFVQNDDAEPTVLFGLDVRKESLPDDVPAQVMQLWRDGHSREAVSLLYRATLSRLIYQFSFQFFDGYTEQECVQVVEVTPSDAVKPIADRSALLEYLRRLTRVWQSIAYGHRLPEDDIVAQLSADWAALFDRVAVHEK